MAPERGLLLGEVFAPCDVLTVPARLELAALLAVPGRTPAVFAVDLAELPVHREVHVEVRDTIMSGLGPAALDQLAGWRLRDVAPAMAGAGGAFHPPGMPVRLKALLERNGAATWAGLGDLTLGGIREWSGVGPRSTVDLIGAVVVGLLDDAPAVPSGLVTTDAIADLGTLAGYGGDHNLRATFEGLSAGHHPEDVRGAAGRLLVALGAGRRPCLSRLEDLLARAGDERARAVFEHRIIRPGPPATLAELGATLGIGTERVRQLCRRAVDAVTSAFEGSRGALSDLVAKTAEELGTCAPAEAIADLLTARNLPPLPDSRSLLLLWLAGAYQMVEHHPGWYATDPAAVATETTLLLLEDGGVRPVEHVTKELERLGMNPEYTGAWLADQPVRLVEALVVATRGSMAQVAERALSATGRAMTVSELGTFTHVSGTTGEVAGLRALLHRDRRFLWVGDDRFELAEWGGGGGANGADPAAGATTAETLVLGFHPGQDDDVVTRVPIAAAHGSRCG